jgi:hypothetical protein
MAARPPSLPWLHYLKLWFTRLWSDTSLLSDRLLTIDDSAIHRPHLAPSAGSLAQTAAHSPTHTVHSPRHTFISPQLNFSHNLRLNFSHNLRLNLYNSSLDGAPLHLLRRLGSQFERIFDTDGWWVLLEKGRWWKFECVVGLENFVKVGFTTMQV